MLTKKVRFSYAHVWEPKAIEAGGDPKYSVCLLIDKSDAVTLKMIDDDVKKLTEEYKAKNGGKLPKKFKLPLRDGDEEREDDPTYRGKFFINASSKTAPGILDRNKDEILDKGEFYSGCYGIASINLYIFDKAGNTGIACGLNNLLKLSDGERLSGGTSADEDFADIDTDLEYEGESLM